MSRKTTWSTSGFRNLLIWDHPLACLEEITSFITKSTWFVQTLPLPSPLNSPFLEFRLILASMSAEPPCTHQKSSLCTNNNVFASNLFPLYRLPLLQTTMHLHQKLSQCTNEMIPTRSTWHWQVNNGQPDLREGEQSLLRRYFLAKTQTQTLKSLKGDGFFLGFNPYISPGEDQASSWWWSWSWWKISPRCL